MILNMTMKPYIKSDGNGGLIIHKGLLALLGFLLVLLTTTASVAAYGAGVKNEVSHNSELIKECKNSVNSVNKQVEENRNSISVIQNDIKNIKESLKEIKEDTKIIIGKLGENK